MVQLLKARVIAVDPVHVHICCPICGKLHLHGSSGNLNEQNYGRRVPHCGTTHLPWTNGAFWDNPMDYEYELICTPQTLRQKADATGYVKRWYRENRLSEYNKMRRQIARDIKQLSRTEHISIEEAYKRLMMNKEPENQFPENE